MSQILQAGGLSGGRQGVMKERIIEIKTVSAPFEVAYSYEKTFDDEVNKLIEKGYDNIVCTQMI